MLYAYPACFYKEKEGYSVIFPDLNEIGTCGETLDEAFRMAIDCLAGYIYTLKMEGTNIPCASSVQATKLDSEIHCEESFVNVVTVDVEEYAKKHFEKSVKKTLTIPKWLNDYAVSEKINFSGVLQNALMQELHIDRP